MTPEQLNLFPDFSPTEVTPEPVQYDTPEVGPDEFTVTDIPDADIEQYQLTKHKELLEKGFNLINNHFDGKNHHYTYRKES